MNNYILRIVWYIGLTLCYKIDRWENDFVRNGEEEAIPILFSNILYQHIRVNITMGFFIMDICTFIVFLFLVSYLCYCDYCALI